MTTTREAAPAANRLINEAQASVMTAMAGQTVTAGDLPAIAQRIRFAILTQAALGKWRAVGVVNPDDLLPLVVTATLGNTLIGEPPIKVAYDFRHTSLPYLVVQCKAAP